MRLKVDVIDPFLKLKSKLNMKIKSVKNTWMKLGTFELINTFYNKVSAMIEIMDHQGRLDYVLFSIKELEMESELQGLIFDPENIQVGVVEEIIRKHREYRETSKRVLSDFLRPLNKNLAQRMLSSCN